MGSAIGGWFSDKVGRKKALLVGDVLFTLGALLMAAAGSPNALIAGRNASVLMHTGITFWSTKSANPSFLPGADVAMLRYMVHHIDSK